MKARDGASSTIRDVALAAGLSTATVSRAMNGDPSVSPEAARRVREAVDLLGYTMNHVARSLKVGSTRTIGVIAPELASDFFMLLAEGMDRELASHGYGLIVCSSWESAEEEAKRMRHLAERLVDGLVVIPATGSGRLLDLERSREASSAGTRRTPLVLVDRSVDGLEADAVLVDNEGGAYAATAALLAEGWPRMGFIGGSLELSTARERYEGWRRAMAEFGRRVEDEYVSFAGLHVDSGYGAMRDMRSRPGAPDAYFLVNAYVHVGATNYLVSEEPPARSANVAFAAFDEMPYSPLLRYCRYSLSQPVAEMGRRAARLLLRRIGGELPSSPETLRLPASLIRHSRGDERELGAPRGDAATASADKEPTIDKEA